MDQVIIYISLFHQKAAGTTHTIYRTKKKKQKKHLFHHVKAQTTIANLAYLVMVNYLEFSKINQTSLQFTDFMFSKRQSSGCQIAGAASE